MYLIELGVDEITLVLQLPSARKSMLLSSEWKDLAEHMLWQFEEQSGIRNIFGEKTYEKKAPEGYTVAYRYGEHSFYFAVAYHDYQSNMGVIVKFSAQSLDFYLQETGLKLYEFLQNITHPEYSQRLSRIDLTADYIDEDIDITEIYQTLMDSKVALFREQENKKTGEMQFRKVPMKYEGFLKGQEVPTIYIGSPKSDSRLRIYDKKREQMERKGTKLEKALSCKGWIRFEAVMRNEYAHQLSSELLNIKTDTEYVNLIALTISQKYRFMEVDNGVAGNPTEYTQLLLNCLCNNQFRLKAASTRNYELARNIAYIFYGSGIMNALYKLKSIWGSDAVIGIMEYILDELENEFKPNDDCRYWLNKNLNDYKKQYPDFDTYMRDNVSQLL